MPVSFNSPPRNLFLLGSGAQDALTNFFDTISKFTESNRYNTSDIAYSDTDQKFLLAGSAKDSNTVSFGWMEKQAYDAETDPTNPTNVEDWRRVFNSPDNNTSTPTTLNFMKQTTSYGGDIIIGGKTGSVPWISKYSASGAQQWVSTSQSGDVEYFGVACTTNGYYACGHKTGTGITAEGFVEKWDTSGNPLWGKSAIHINGEVKLNKIAANNKGEVVVVGSVTDQAYIQGYLAKIDTTNGDILWDRTINSGRSPSLGAKNDVEVKNVYIDGNDQIYVVGTEFADTVPVYQKGFIIKYSAEGNLIWHKTTPSFENHDFLDLWSDTPVEQTVILSRETLVTGNTNLSLIKYSKNGDVVFRRRIIPENNSAPGKPPYVQPTAGLDGDPSFYYILFVEQEDNVSNGTAKSYTFGKVSASGNGFGEFTYSTGVSHAGEPQDITYVVNTNTPSNPIGRLADGSVRNDSSDFISYPYSGLNLLLGDDLATNVAYKKTRHKEKDLFDYHGSPAIRPVDNQSLDIRSKVETSTFTETVNTSPTDQQEYTTAGTFSWTAPADVTSVSVVAIGAGGGGYDNTAGGGGGLGWKNNISVTPGSSYTVVVGNRGVKSAYPASQAEDSYFISTSTVKGGGGNGGGGYPDGGVQLPGDGFGGDYVGDGGGNGGNGGSGASGTTGSPPGGGGGGGAGGYSGNGGNGGFAQSAGGSGSGGSGGGGGGGGNQGYPNNQQGGGGGGVGIFGEGSNGNGGVFVNGGQSTGGTGGSGGVAGELGATIGTCNSGNSNTHAKYGGGGASGGNGNCARGGADGAVRIIWGTGRSFPSTLTADQTPAAGGTTTQTTTQTVVKDQSGNGLDGTVDGASQDSKGFWNFDGTNDVIEFPESPSFSFGSGDFTIESWIYPTSSVVFANIFSTEDFDFKLQFLAVRIYTTGGSNTSATCNLNEWNHVLFYRKSSTFYVSINGVEQTVTPPAFTGDGSSAAEIGRKIRSASEYFIGKIAEVRVYQRALTAPEISQNYNARKVLQGLATETRPDITGIVIDPTLRLNFDFGDELIYTKSHNLFPYGRTPGDLWSGAKAGSIWTENTTEVLAPDGSYTATKWEFTNTDPYLYHQGTLTANKTYTMSMWVKAGSGMTGEVLQFRIGGSPYSTNANSTIPADGSWKRITFTKTIGGSNETNVNIGFEPQHQGGVPAVGNVIYVWGAQLEEGSSASTVILTDSVTVNKPTYATTIAPKSISGYTTALSNQVDTGNLFNTSTYNNITYDEDDGAFVFNGTDSEIQLSSSHVTGFSGLAAGFTLEAWVNTSNFTPTDGDSSARVVGIGGTGLSGDIAILNSGQFRARGAATGGTAGKLALDPDAMNLNQWYHLICTLTESRYIKAYTNGVLKDTFDHGVGNAAFNAGGRSVQIGRYVDGGNSFQYTGKIGQIRVYARGLSASEALTNFEATRTRYGV